MKLNLKLSILSIGFIAIFTGCGGGGGSSQIGTAYYLDSAVAGVSYKCGNQTGVTASDGGFNFESGHNCSFYIGDYEFKEISSAKLTNGAKIVEDDTKIAAILQTLDDDGDPDNGIHIRDHVAKVSGEVLKTHHQEIHSNVDAVLDDLVVKIDSDNQAEVEYHGHKVDEHDAAEHLNKTREQIKQEHQGGASGSGQAHGGDQDHNGGASGSGQAHGGDQDHNGGASGSGQAHGGDQDHNGEAHGGDQDHNGEAHGGDQDHNGEYQHKGEMEH